jgi:GNAT superfamily N-acetyltransferase
MPALETAAFEKTRALTPELIDHIEKVVWGVEAGVRYRILDRQAELEWVLPHGYILIMRKDARLIGTLLCLQKTVSLGNGSSIRVLYETTLTVLPSEHGKGHAKSLVQEAETNADRRSIEYAYIEEKNIPSAAAFKAQGFQTIGQFHATTFNRLRPKLSGRVRQLPSGQADQMKTLLSELYRDHTFTDFDVSLRPENYWVLMENNHIMAGAQVEEELWSIVSMPGLDGWFAAKVLPRLPLLRRILNPARIPVLKIGNLFVPEGHEKDFMKLVEHLTHHYRKKLALAYLDLKSPVTKRLKRKLNFGLFNLFFETPVNIWARSHGLDQEEMTSLQGRPFHISPIDIS